MPRFHNHLKQQLDFDCLEPSGISDEDEEYERDDAMRRAAKRRRIEAIAAQCMRDRPPLILSAGLRGPFNKGWKNPWAKMPLKKAEPKRAAGRERKQLEQSLKGCINDAGATPVSRGQDASSVPSPETSRAITAVPHTLADEDEQDEAEVLVTAPPPQGDNLEGIDDLRIGASQLITVDKSESNPFWLRRQPVQKIKLEQFKVGNHDPSPSRARYGHRPVSENGEVYLAPPKAPLVNSPPTPAKNLELHMHSGLEVPEPITSTSPAASITSISSKFKGSAPLKEEQHPAINVTHEVTGGTAILAGPDEPPDSAIPLSEVNIPTLKALQQIEQQDSNIRPSLPQRAKPMKSEFQRHEVGYDERVQAFTPINTVPRNSQPGSQVTYTNLLGSTDATAILLNGASPRIAAAHRAATKLALLAVNAAQKTRPALRDEICASAERCASSAPSSSKARSSGRKPKSTPANNRRSSSQKHVNPASRTGPLYETARGDKSGRRSQVLQPSPIKAESRRVRRDVYEVPSSDEMEQPTLPSQPNSGYSTQAAMMRARLEFQEGSMSSGTVETPDPWQEAQHDNAHKDGDEPSLGLTPFSAFNANLDPNHTQGDSSDELPISTQELFSAASPFAFSTVKKPSKAQGSGLRFAVFPSGTNEAAEEHSGAKSPTPSERVPLKERNSKMVVRSTNPEKGSQESLRRNVEWAPLDSRTSLDDVGPHGDLDFTDRFLQHVNDMT